jgi:hypothetical protein
MSAHNSLIGTSIDSACARKTNHRLGDGYVELDGQHPAAW